MPRSSYTLDRLVSQLSPRMRAAYEQLIDQVRDSLDMDRLTAAIASGNHAEAMNVLADAMKPNLNTVRAAIADNVARAGAVWMHVEVPKYLQVEFSIGLPEAAKVMQTLDLSLLPEMTKSMEAGFRETMKYGLEQGMNPRDTARLARGHVGFTDYDVKIIRSFERQLREEPERVLGRTLRDRRFDGTVTKAADGRVTLSEAQIRTMRDAYSERLHNWRAETWSRTATLDAARQSQAAAWKQVASDSVVAADRFVKTWITTLDGRERPEHHAAHGTTVPLDAQFPVDGGVDVPGQNAYNCRCTMAVRILPSNEERRAAFLSSAQRLPLGAPT